MSPDLDDWAAEATMLDPKPSGTLEVVLGDDDVETSAAELAESEQATRGAVEQLDTSGQAARAKAKSTRPIAGRWAVVGQDCPVPLLRPTEDQELELAHRIEEGKLALLRAVLAADLSAPDLAAVAPRNAAAWSRRVERLFRKEAPRRNVWAKLSRGERTRVSEA